jgi:hypothetical protein
MMLDIIKQAIGDKSSALVIIISVMIMAIAGSYKLLTDRLNDEHRDITQLQEDVHELDKRVLTLEIKNED